MDEAIACYNKAIELDPKLAIAHNNLGVALHDKGRTDEAIACFSKAIELDPKFAMAHYNLGIALRDKGRMDEAIASYTQGHRARPEVTPRPTTTWALRCIDKGRTDEAIACFTQGHRTRPEVRPAHTNLGVALRDKGRLDEAIACLQARPSSSTRSSPWPTTTWAMRCAARARWTRPSPPTTRPSNSTRSTPWPTYNLGIALEDKGRLDEAIASYKKAIELDPKHANAISGLRRRGATGSGPGQVPRLPGRQLHAQDQRGTLGPGRDLPE